MAGKHRGHRILMLSRAGRFTLVAIVGAFIIAGLSCGSAPDAPEYDNPIIPDDPNFELPQTTIISGPIDGAVIDTHAVTFTWKGNQANMIFAHQLNEAGQLIEVGWSDWATDTTATFQYLDEGDYLFEVQGQYASGVIEDTAAFRNYTIDDIHGPALRLYPRYQQVNVGSEFSLEVMLEEVANVFAVKVILVFDPAALQVSNVEVYEDSRSLLKANGGTVIPFSSYDNAVGTITIEVATATGDPPGVSGTGAVAKITVAASSYGQLYFGPATSLRDTANGEIAISETVRAVVEVQ